MKKGLEYLVEKYRSLELGGGVLSSLINALFLLSKEMKIGKCNRNPDASRLHGHKYLTQIIIFH